MNCRSEYMIESGKTAWQWGSWSRNDNDSLIIALYAHQDAVTLNTNILKLEYLCVIPCEIIQLLFHFAKAQLKVSLQICYVYMY